MNNTNRADIKILVVDDEPDVLEGTARLLEKAGYTVNRAADGEAGLKILHDQGVDLLLLDRDLPGINGLGLCRRLKREPATADLFVVIISGTYVEADDQAEGLELGADGYIARPIANRELLARVEAFVRIMQLNRSLRRNAEELRAKSEAATRASDASLNLMEDAVEARDRLQRINEDLRREITERKAAELLLREQAEIISNAHEGVMIVNLSNEIILWNRGAEQIFGCPAVHALGRTPESVLGVLDVEQVAKLRETVKRDGFWHGEFRSQTRDHRQIVVDCRTTLVSDAAGQPRARLNFFADITEQKLLEEKFLHAQRLESIGMLAAGIAHDLNNVLAPIVFAAPMLRASLTNDRDLKILNTLERSAERGAGLVKQILGFAHTSTGELRATQVKHLARDISDIVESTFPKSIRCDQHIPNDLWAVLGNATQIHQVLLNLCVNARDAMPAGGTLRLALANRSLDSSEAAKIPGARAGDWLVLEVSDSGTGIPPEVLAHIWDPFFTTKPVGKGTGLGLSTVRGIVTTHRGFITLDTKPGEGTTFRVFLPAAEDFSRSSPKPVPPNSVGHGELILVVDDDTAIRETVAVILEKYGYRVLKASDGTDAVNHFTERATEVALVITDIDMPRLDGSALVRVLHQLRPGLPIIQISGLARNAKTPAPNRPEAVNVAEPPPFLQKPFTPDALLEAVARLLQSNPPL